MFKRYESAVAGFSLHAGVAARVNECDNIKGLFRNIARPALGNWHLSLAGQGFKNALGQGCAPRVSRIPPSRCPSGTMAETD